MRARLVSGFAVLASALASSAHATPPAGAWVPDLGDGRYANPVLMGDYSDPDAIRVGDSFYLVASSFANAPGLPILQSKDLVNWTIVGHALSANLPYDHFRSPRRGGGVWAPAIRFHDERFYIYYPDPDLGVFMISARDPKGPWTAPVRVDDTKGAIDPCPFWDDDGQGWLVHAFAASRAGKSNLVVLKRLSADGSRTVGEGRVIIDGAKLPHVETSIGAAPWFTIEGPKLYKRKGWYYIFAPAGSVKGGWQGVFRSRTIDGPYEARDVLDQGDTPVNGPHQGAWVRTPGGQDWFLHFQDTDSYGRRVWLEPMVWKDGWPLIGRPVPGRTYGEPVLTHEKPDLPPQPVSVPAADDDFRRGYNLAWQWNSNPGDDWVAPGAPGELRLTSVSSSANLWEAGNVLTQKLPNTSFTAQVKLELHPRWAGERAGLVLFGKSYGFIGLENRPDGVALEQVTRVDADCDAPETTVTAPVRVAGPVWLRVHVEPFTHAVPPPDFSPYFPAMLRAQDAKVSFSYSLDGATFTPLGDGFVSQPGMWVGAQVGLFAQAPSGTPAFVSTRIGYAGFGDFRILP